MIGRRLWWATLRKDSIHYQFWHDILQSDDIPLRSPVLRLAVLGNPTISNVEADAVYELDISALSPDQRARLISFI